MSLVNTVSFGRLLIEHIPRRETHALFVVNRETGIRGEIVGHKVGPEVLHHHLNRSVNSPRTM